MLQDSEGTWVTDPVEVKKLVVQYWESLFTEETPNAIITNFLPGCFPPIPSEEWSNITRPYATCEVRATIWSMKPYKAPGPDGFQPIFYQRFWSLVEPSVSKTVLNILEGKEFPEDLKKAF